METNNLNSMTTEELKAVEEAAINYSHYTMSQVGFIQGAEFLSNLRKPSEPAANVGESGEELVEQIAALIEADLIQSYAPNFYEEDDSRLSLLDLFSHTDSIDSGRENIHTLVDGMDCIEEIAALMQPGKELIEALKKIKTMCDGNITNENNIWHTCNDAISNYEKQK